MHARIHRFVSEEQRDTSYNRAHRAYTRLSAVAPQFEIQEGKVCLPYTRLSFPRAGRFRNRRNEPVRGRRGERRTSERGQTASQEEGDSGPVSSGFPISRNFHDEAPIARDLFTSASRRAPARLAAPLPIPRSRGSPGLSDEARAQIAIKTFRFYSRASPRAR